MFKQLLAVGEKAQISLQADIANSTPKGQLETNVN
jgi:hypothetical protein